MAERLADLKKTDGQASSPSGHSTPSGAGFYHSPEKRAPAQQADDLIAQMGAEVKIEESAPKMLNPVEVREINKK